jgi:hypothetical protein
MATEKQMAFFKSLYDEEAARHAVLMERAKTYITVITIYIGIVGLKVGDLTALTKDFRVPWALLLCIALAVGAALLLTVMAIRVREFEALVEPEKAAKELDAPNMTDEKFFANRIADYVVATQVNRKVVNDIGFKLRLAVMFLAGGVALHLFTVLVALNSQAPK